METIAYPKIPFFYPDVEFQKRARVSDSSLYEEAAQDPVHFWEQRAHRLAWFKKWDVAFKGTFQEPQWFCGGEINACYNCLDRHLLTASRDKVAIHWEGERGETRQLTYLELYEEVGRLANVLRSLGVGMGDRVAIYMPLVPEAIAGMLACARIGALHTVIFSGVGEEGIRERIEDAEAKVVLTADGCYRRGKVLLLKEIVDAALQKGCVSVRHVLVVRRTASPIAMEPKRDLFYSECMEQASIHAPAAAVESEHPLFILYTSGSTGKPKGIYHSTAGYLTGVHATFGWVFDIRDDDVYWCTADTGWITGHSFVVYGPLMHGATLLTYEGTFDTPDCARAWKLIEKYKVTIFYTAPTAIRTFIKWGDQWPASADLSSLRLLGSIGEPINPDVWLWYYRVIGGSRCPIVDTWFQTETGALVISPLPGYTPMKPGSVTSPLPGFKADVLDEAGNPASIGMLALQSPTPSMMRGIYKNPERYRSTYWSKWGGRYYFAGDFATKDEDGYFWVTGRTDDIMKVSGHRIGTAEVESALVDYPAVAESAVVALPELIKGEEIWAFVILKRGSTETASDSLRKTLRAHVAKKIGSYAAPSHIVFVDELPKTRSGKIMRRLLKNVLENKPSGDTTTLENPMCLQEIKKHFEKARS